MQAKSYHSHAFPGPMQKGPLRHRVIKTAVEYGMFYISLDAGTWGKIRHLAPPGSSPGFYNNRIVETRSLFRSAIRQAARKGEFDLLHRLYMEQFDPKGPAKTFDICLSGLFLHPLPRKAAISELVKEASCSPLSREMCIENCLVDLYPYIQRQKFRDWHSQLILEQQNRLPPRELIARLLINSGEYRLNPEKALALVESEWPEMKITVRQKDLLRKRLREWAGKVILEHTDGSGNSDGWKYLFSRGVIVPVGDRFFKDEVAAGAALSLLAKELGGAEKISGSLLCKCFMYCLERNLYDGKGEVTGRLGKRIAELIAKADDAPSTPRRAPAKPLGKEMIPGNAQAPAKFFSKLPEPEKIKKDEVEGGRQPGEGTRGKKKPQTAQASVWQSIHMRLDPVSEKVAVVVKVTKQGGGAGCMITEAAKRPGRHVHFITIDFSSQEWLHEYMLDRESFKPGELNRIIRQIIGSA